MRAFARNLLPVALLLADASAGWAADGVYLPPAPGGPGGEDSIETPGGTRCRQSMNSNGAYLDIGMAGTAAKPLDNARAIITEQRDQSALAYARVTVPLGRRPQRIDCGTIYDLEIQRLRREVELLKLAAE